MSDDDEPEYVVLWTNGSRNFLSSRAISDLPCDLASWMSFAGLVFGRRRFAQMTVHMKERGQAKTQQARIIPRADFNADMSYAHVS